MIGFLKGSLISQNMNSLLVEAGGVGYEVHVYPSGARQIQKGDFVSFWIYTCLKPDSLELYGFASPQEKELFLSLLKVRGIGPKLALRILGSCSLERFVQMISEENIKALSALPKVGKKTAQQIILSLKEKIPDKLIGSETQSPQGSKLFSALENLGFQPSEIREALEQIKPEDSFKTNLKRALALLRSY